MRKRLTSTTVGIVIAFMIGLYIGSISGQPVAQAHAVTPEQHAPAITAGCQIAGYFQTFYTTTSNAYSQARSQSSTLYNSLSGTGQAAYNTMVTKINADVSDISSAITQFKSVAC